MLLNFRRCQTKTLRNMQIMIDGCHEKYCIQLTCFISGTCILKQRNPDYLFHKCPNEGIRQNNQLNRENNYYPISGQCSISIPLK